jgi:hypothetical protein
MSKISIIVAPFQAKRMGIDGLTACMQDSKELREKLSSLPKTCKEAGCPPSCVLAWDISGMPCISLLII